MGRKNYLIEGVSCSGKTSLCDEMFRRGFHAIHGDRALAYQGNPETGEPLPGGCHEHHIWDIAKVEALVADKSQPITFFCGGSRNVHKFIHRFDAVFVLDLDVETLKRRLDDRPADEFGASPQERALVLRLHETCEDIPEGIRIDATKPLHEVADRILFHCGWDG